MSTATIERAECSICDGYEVPCDKGEFAITKIHLECPKCKKDGWISAKYCPECGRPFHLRPMTLEEAVLYVQKHGSDGTPLWMEVKKMPINGKWMTCEQIMAHVVKSGEWGEKNTRFWASPTTPEQSAAWEWEEGAINEAQ